MTTSLLELERSDTGKTTRPASAASSSPRQMATDRLYDNLDAQAMMAMKISFYLNRPLIVPEHPMHLDAILAYARMEMAKEAGHHSDFSPQYDLPLAVHDGQTGSVFKASQIGLAVSEASAQFHMKRHTDIYEMQGDHERGVYAMKTKIDHVNLGSGRFKNYSFQVPTQWTDKAVAFCVGHPQEVAKLLARIDHIGKLGRLGYGNIIRIEIETEADIASNIGPMEIIGDGRSLVLHGPDATRRQTSGSQNPAQAWHKAWQWRNMPDDMSDGDWQYAAVIGRLMPPYWSAERRVVYEPVSQLPALFTAMP